MREMSDEELRALPAVVGLPTAARALGIGSTKAYQLARAGEFPCALLRLGSRYRVSKAELFRVLGVSAGSPAMPEGELQAAASPGPAAAAVLPAGGIPVVLVLQAVILPGDWQELAATWAGKRAGAPGPG
jgi:hypothetical protein